MGTLELFSEPRDPVGPEGPEGLDDPILEGLNPPQREAVLACDGPVLILAGAGSGKTRAITHKIAWLVGRLGYAPWEILAVTFTNKAAREMKERCERLVGAAADDLWMGTFHRIGVRILRRHGELLGVPTSFGIYDQDDQRAMVGRAIEDLGFSKERVEPRMVQRFIEKAKQEARGPDDVQAATGFGGQDDVYVRVYRRYEERMREARAVDFGDLLMLPLRLMREHPLVRSEYRARWRYVLVDEFQDTNKVQYDLLKAVVNDERRICVVGDDDQSIYRWRGAEVGNILGFADDFPGATVVRLEQNYRSSASILATAGHLIRKNEGRHEKTLWTERDAGEPVRVHQAATDGGEADYVVQRIRELRATWPLREMAIFYRTHAQSRSIEDALRQNGISYQVVGGLKFYERAEVKDLLAYLRLLVNPADTIAAERIVNTPRRGIGQKTVADVHARAEASGLTFLEACRALSGEPPKGRAEKLAAFVALMDDLRELAAGSRALAVAQTVLEKTGYLEILKAEGTAEADARIENLHELLNALDEFAQRTGDGTLAAFLEQVALVSEIDDADLAQDRVVMMSAHTAKGLEFDVVFLTGLEHGLLPHFNSIGEPQGLEEERRLAYVAMTRARHVLHLTHAENRRRFGTLAPAMPSPFLDDLPEEHLRHDRGGARRAFNDGFRSPARPAAATSPWSRTPSPWSRPASPRPRPPMPTWDEHAQEMPDYDGAVTAVSAASDPEGGLAPRATVFHPTFGEGTVVRLTGEGRDAIVQVRFRGGDERKIVARFLTLA